MRLFSVHSCVLMTVGAVALCGLAKAHVPNTDQQHFPPGFSDAAYDAKANEANPYHQAQSDSSLSHDKHSQFAQFERDRKLAEAAMEASDKHMEETYGSDYTVDSEFRLHSDGGDWLTEKNARKLIEAPELRRSLYELLDPERNGAIHIDRWLKAHEEVNDHQNDDFTVEKDLVRYLMSPPLSTADHKVYMAFMGGQDEPADPTAPPPPPPPPAAGQGQGGYQQPPPPPYQGYNAPPPAGQGGYNYGYGQYQGQPPAQQQQQHRPTSPQQQQQQQQYPPQQQAPPPAYAGYRPPPGQNGYGTPPPPYYQNGYPPPAYNVPPSQQQQQQQQPPMAQQQAPPAYQNDYRRDF